MKFSRNPITGDMESYTDDGIFAGTMITFGDLIGTNTAEDGGPGSGNFGHKGRPGKVGGSGPGGGKQYRGGRSDIGYFGSRKDWLNGLSGEEQHDAVRFIAGQKSRLQDRLEAKNKIEAIWRRGFITRAEADERLKEGKLESLREDMPVEEYIMKAGSEMDKVSLIERVKNSRNWNDNADRLKKENLTEEEQKVLDYLKTKNGKSPTKESFATMLDLEAKAMDIPYSGEPIPEELLYESGVKARPVPSNGVHMDWYKKKEDREMAEGRMVELYMARITDDNYMDFANSREQFEKLNQNFSDTLKYKDMNPSDIRCEACRAMNELRALSKFNPDQEAINKLTDEEKDLIHRADEVFCPRTHSPVIDAERLKSIQLNISWDPLKTKAERRLAQDFLLLEHKMMTGITPKSEDESEVLKKLKEEKKRKEQERKEAKKKAEERAKRDEQLKKEEYERREAGIKADNPLAGFSRDEKSLNQEHLDDVLKGVNPHYADSKANDDERYTSNCQRCVLAFVARLRGYKVEAKPYIGRPGYRDPIFLDGGIKKVFEGADDAHVDGGTAVQQREKIESSLTEWGNGAVGIISVAWAHRNSAHAYIAMNDNGVIKWFDPQCPSKDASTYISTGNIKCWYTKMMRVDDKKFTNWVHQAVRPEGGQYDDNFNG